MYEALKAHAEKSFDSYIAFCEKKSGKKTPLEAKRHIHDVFVVGWLACALGMDWAEAEQVAKR